MTDPANDPASDPPTKARRAFAPVLLLGLSSAVVVALAGNRPAAAPTGERAKTFAATGFVTYDAHLPAATAAALVVLACWGVVLVSRGLLRRSVAVLGALAAVGAVAAVATSWGSIPDDLARNFSAAGYVDAGVHHTAWFWSAVVGSVLTLVASVLAVRLIPQWPEMGSRYDAPASGAQSASATPPTEQSGDQSSLDLWKAIDEGRDPTA